MRVNANANGWHISLGIRTSDRQNKIDFLTIGSADISAFKAVLEEAFETLETIVRDETPATVYRSHVIKGDVSIFFHANGLMGIAFRGHIALLTRKELNEFNDALENAPEVGERLYTLRKEEFQRVIERRAISPLPAAPDMVSEQVIYLTAGYRRPRKVHDFEISEWQGNPPESVAKNSPRHRRSQAQSRKRTAVRNREADAALLPWKILAVVITIAVAWVSYTIKK